MQLGYKVRIGFLAILFAWTYTDPYLVMGQVVCGRDMDQDGEISKGEVAACPFINDQAFCPIEAVACQNPSSPVSCPTATSWNREVKQCEGAPISNGVEYMAVKTDSGRTERNDCRFPEESVLPEGTNVVLNPPAGAVFVNERYVITHCRKRRGKDTATFDVYAYYSLQNIACPAGSLLNSDKSLCIASPSCSTGTYDSVSGQCNSGIKCPLDTETRQFACLNAGQGFQCSQNQCEDVSRFEETKTDLASFRDDGQTDAGGMCKGQIMIFNGKAMECRKAGLQTGYHNCCRNDSESILEFTKSCKDKEKTLIANRDGGVCHLVGTYCKKKSILGCLQRAESYCCFGSKLARIIHEQGRGQLKEYSANNLWGSPSQPFCNGMSPEQLSMLDFNQIDLTEFVGSLVTDKDLVGSVETKINEFYRDVSR